MNYSYSLPYDLLDASHLQLWMKAASTPRDAAALSLQAHAGLSTVEVDEFRIGFTDLERQTLTVHGDAQRPTRTISIEDTLFGHLLILAKAGLGFTTPSS